MSKEPAVDIPIEAKSNPNELSIISPSVLDTVSPSDVEVLKEELRDKELREADLTRKKLFKVVSEALEAEEYVVSDGGVVVFKEPNHEVRLKAAKEAREILGETAIPSKGRVMPNIIVKLPNGTVIGAGW